MWYNLQLFKNTLYIPIRFADKISMDWKQYFFYTHVKYPFLAQYNKILYSCIEF